MLRCARIGVVTVTVALLAVGCGPASDDGLVVGLGQQSEGHELIRDDEHSSSSTAPAPGKSAGDSPKDVPQLTLPSDEGRRAPVGDDEEPVAVDYLGLGRWPCEDLDGVTGGALRRLTGAGAEERWRVYCYVLNGAEGEPFAPPRDGAGPWQAGVLYTDRDAQESTLDEILDAGGVLLSVDFGVPESPPASTEADNNPSSLWTEAEGEPAVLHRTAPTRLAAVWFAGRSDERVRVILMTGGDERRALELMAAVEPGVPGS